jgi:hypothetical protein
MISSLLVELTFELTRINKYVDLLPSNHRLQDLSCSIFDDYVDCCISAVKFFRRNPIGMYLGVKTRIHLADQLSEPAEGIPQ